jgi:hypothetical protein
MALDIGVGDGSSPFPIPGAPAILLQDDGIYWFLHPLFERLRTETGQYIDLYGDAAFEGQNLSALERILVEARRLVACQPEAWEVHVGAQMSPVHCELFKPVQRQAMLDLLDQWEAVIQFASQQRRPVVCFGD